MHHRSRRPGTGSLGVQLYMGFLLIGLLSLCLCGAVYWRIVHVNRDSVALAQTLRTETEPACRLDQEAEALAHAVSKFARTHAEADIEAAKKLLLQTAAAVAAEAQLSVAKGDRQIDRAVSAAVDTLKLMRELIERAAWQFRMTDRSTRGIASQSSLLLTACGQLLADETGEIQGARAPTFRKHLVMALGQLGEVQNATLFAHASVDAAQLERAKIAAAKMSQALAELAAVTPESALRDFVLELVQSARDLDDEIANLSKGLEERKRVVEQLAQSVERLRSLLSPAVAAGVERAIGTSTRTTTEANTLRWAVLWGSMALFALGAGVALWLSRRLQALLRPIVASLKHAATGLAAATGGAISDAEGLADLAHAQAASLHQVSSSSEQISAAASENVVNIAAARDKAAHTTALIDHGEASVNEMNAAMRAVSETSGSIERTVVVIDEIAFQINLLSLNAAIEAARAGEKGNGFAVVADEVRNLAQRSAAAARETAMVVGQAKKAAVHGVSATREVESNFRAISCEIAEVGVLLDRTAQGSSRQANEVVAITTAIKACEAATQASSERADRVSALAAELHDQARVLSCDAESLARVTSWPEPRTGRVPRPGSAWRAGGCNRTAEFARL